MISTSPSPLSATAQISMNLLFSMLRRLEARLDASEQRWSMAQPPPRLEPDPPYGMPLSWQTSAWCPSSVATPAVAVSIPHLSPMASTPFVSPATTEWFRQLLWDPPPPPQQPPYSEGSYEGYWKNYNDFYANNPQPWPFHFHESDYYRSPPPPQHAPPSAADPFRWPQPPHVSDHVQYPPHLPPFHEQYPQSMDISVEVDPDGDLSNHRILPSGSSVLTPKASATVLIPTKSKGSNNEDASDKSTSGPMHKHFHSRKLLDGDPIIKNGGFGEDTEEQRNVQAKLDASSIGSRNPASLANLESTNNKAAKEWASADGQYFVCMRTFHFIIPARRGIG